MLPVRLLTLAACLGAGSAMAASAQTPATAPTPHISFDGPALNFDFPAVKIGVAEYEEGPTGTTVLYFPQRVLAAIDVRGGAPGTFNSDALHNVHDEAFVNAIVLSGGSAYGLSAAAGVANALKETTPDPGNWRNVAVVAGAIIFDLGDRRYNAVTPDELLGRAALRTARSGWFPLGARGAGSFAMQGAYLGDRQHSGEGAALRQMGDTKVLVVTVVNALGSITDRTGRLLRCSSPINGQCEPIAAKLAARLQGAGEKLSDVKVPTDGPTANTTITVVVTNQALAFSALQRLAIQVHNSMARAIQPFGTFADGDTLFAVTTGEVKNSALNVLDLNTLASETAWDAILATAPVMPSLSARSATLPTRATLQSYVGRYTLAPDVTADVHWQDNELAISVAGRDSLYLPADKAVVLKPWAAEEFALATVRADHVRFDRDARGRISGFSINPGPWPIRAQRLPGP
jgi:L-aminopeptidase/D-esterase-like protein